MSISKTVVISCAGMGNRLGIGTTKALINILGKPLIIRQLEMLKHVDDIRIVVGFQAERVIEVVNKYRSDVLYVFNHNYMNNGTGASLSLASAYANDLVISLDGDLLVHPEDLELIINSEQEFVGGGIPSTDNPVFMQTSIVNHQKYAVAFSREKGEYEWTGLVQARRDNLLVGEGHVYELLEHILPLPMKFVRTKEIDTLNDYENAVKWVENGYRD